MRILIAHSFYRVPGGEDRYVTQQLGLLSGSHEVELLSAENEGLAESITTARRMFFSRSLIADVETKIKGFRPDVVHVHNVYPALGPAVHLAAARLGVPLVMTVHNYRLRCPNGLMFTEGHVCHRCETGSYVHATLHRCFPSRAQAAAYATSLWIHRFPFRLDDKVALFVAPSVFMGEQLPRWGISPARVRVIRNFTDTPVESSSFPGEFGVYAGRLSKEKGLDVLLRALKLAADPPFTVIGDGPEKGQLERLAIDLGLRRVSFVGRVPPEQVRPMLERARFVAFPSLCHENAPVAALEAMAAGRPLLVTPRGGLPELADQGRGLVCSAGDVRDTADKLRLLMENDDLCKRAGEAGLIFARNELAPANHRAQLEDAYEAVGAAAEPSVQADGGEPS